MKNASLILLFVSAIGCAADTSDDSLDAAIADGKADSGNASRFTRKAKPTNVRLATLATELERSGKTYAGTYRFNKPTTESHDPVARAKRIKEVMHRYQCNFFDESIDLTRPTGSVTVKTNAVASDLDFDSNSDTFSMTAFTAKIAPVFADTKLDLLSGSASGNNTAGEVMGVYDVTNNEVYYFGFTNCGSDD